MTGTELNYNLGNIEMVKIKLSQIPPLFLLSGPHISCKSVSQVWKGWKREETQKYIAYQTTAF